MLVEYKYRLYDGGRRGFYQCDKADFRAFWRCRPELVWCVAIVGDSAWWWGSSWAESAADVAPHWRRCSVAFARSC